MGTMSSSTQGWPTGVDYIRAVQCRDDRLGPGYEFAEGLLGSPRTAHGRHAIVFRFDHASGERVALRCFTSAQPDAERRYREFDDHLRRHPVAAFPAVEWLDDGVEVAGDPWPALRMEWIEGVRLDRWIDQRIAAGDTDALRSMAARWRAIATDVAAAGIGHGDYQHGNVLVDEDDRLRLVDLDGMWVPSLADAPADECGHEAYQHPRRAAEGVWGEEVDGFAALVIWLSLRAVAAEPNLWADRDPHDEHLVLDESDLADLDAPAWARLESSPDPDVVLLTERLRVLLRAPLEAIPGVDRTLAEPAERLVLPVDLDRARDAARRDAPSGRMVDGNAAPTRRPLRRWAVAALMAVLAFSVGAAAAARTVDSGGGRSAAEAVGGSVAESSPDVSGGEPDGSDSPGNRDDRGPDGDDAETEGTTADDAPVPGGESADDAEPEDADGGPDHPPHLEGREPGPITDQGELPSTTEAPRPPETSAPPVTTTTAPPSSTTTTTTTTTAPPTSTTTTTTTTTTVPPLPALRAEIATSGVRVDVGVPLTFDGSGSTGDPDSFLWSWDFAGRTTTGAVVTYWWPEPGTYEVTLTVTRGSETHTASISVEVESSAVVVPNLLGMAFSDAKALVESLGLQIQPEPVRWHDVPRYTVVIQDTVIGSTVPAGTVVDVYLADIPYCDEHPERASCQL